MTSESFRVDLRGVVDILSHHLYSSPRVYLRELVQNARDAVVARRRLEPGAPEDVVVTVEPGAGAVVVRDRGIGLTEDEMRTVLATIGASSKRDDLLRARDRYLGQFGIGLLSCFLVADRIEVTSRSAREPDAPTLRWVGSADGTFTVGPADATLDGPGTVVRLVARPDEREWTTPARVRLLLARFAALLDLPVHLEDGEAGWGAELVSRRTPPWRASDADLAEWCRAEMGFVPLAALPISVPAAGVVGLALVVDSPGRVGVRRGDQVWSRGMHVADDSTQLAPPWAYFVRLVVEAGDLPLTASRESLQHTAAVEQVAEQVGVQVREGIERFARRDPATFARFMEVHDKGLLAMAASDPDMLALVVTHKRWETSEGPMTLAQAVRTRGSVRWTASRTDFATFAPVLRAHGRLLVNGSYVYGAEILERVGSAPTQAHRLRRFDPDRFLRELGEPAGDDEVARRLPGLAGPVLQRLGVALELRRFAPDAVPVLYVAPPPRGFADAAATDEAAADGPDDPWADFAEGFSQDDVGPRLVVNAASGAVRALVGIADARVRDEAVTGLLLIGRLSAGEKLDERDTALLGETLATLVVAAGAPALERPDGTG